MKCRIILLLLITIPMGVACGSDNANRISWNDEAQVQSGEYRVQLHGENGSSRPYKSTPPLFGQIDNPTEADSILTVYYVDSPSDSMAVDAVGAFISQYPDLWQRQQKAHSQETVRRVVFMGVKRVRVAADGSFFIRSVNDYQDPGVTWLVVTDAQERIVGVRDVSR